MKINMSQFKKWIAALDSGKYSQGKLYLQTNNGYCCLGVGCIITIPENKLRFHNGLLYGAGPSEQAESPEWLQAIDRDFEKKAGHRLSYLNDKLDFTFPEIATMLELVYIHKAFD